MENWRVTAEEVAEIIAIEPRLKESDFFDYALFMTPFLVKKDALYKEKFERGCVERYFYSVYVAGASYSSVYLNVVCNHIMRQRFPKLFETPFVTKRRKYPESVKDIKMDTPIGDLGKIIGVLPQENELLVSDIIDIVVNSNADKMEMKSTWKVYSDGDIFFKTDDAEEHCVYVKIEDLYNNDWQAVLDRKVYSIKMENGMWYEGKQENAPYMNNPIAKAVEKFVKEC
jgi:hypothetical protein